MLHSLRDPVKTPQVSYACCQTPQVKYLTRSLPDGRQGKPVKAALN
jgi:hypothetical protein